MLSKTNKAYVAFERSTALDGDLLDAATAVMACYWSYCYMGEYMSTRIADDVDPLYRSLYEKFTDADYVANNQRMKDLIDSLSENMPEERLAKAVQVVKTGSEFELAFWNMSWTMNPED